MLRALTFQVSCQHELSPKVCLPFQFFVPGPFQAPPASMSDPVTQHRGEQWAHDQREKLQRLATEKIEQLDKIFDNHIRWFQDHNNVRYGIYVWILVFALNICWFTVQFILGSW